MSPRTENVITISSPMVDLPWRLPMRVVNRGISKTFCPLDCGEFWCSRPPNELENCIQQGTLKRVTLQETSPHIPLKGKAGKLSTQNVPNGNYRICDVSSLRIFIHICAEPTQNLHFSEYVLKIKLLGLYHCSSIEIWRMSFFAQFKCCLISSPKSKPKKTQCFFHTSLIFASIFARIPPLPSRSTFRICPNKERAEGAFFWT